MMQIDQTKSIGLLTSGGDAPGMNAAVRAVVRTALDRGVEVYAIYEGYEGMVSGGDGIRKMDWTSVSGILHKGGTVIGTARSQAFRTREGRREAAFNLLSRGITRLVVIGGDGSLTGASLFQEEWPSLLAELAAEGRITEESARQSPYLAVVGLVGSIDNDMAGTDMTIGADTALIRITEAIDAISSTAASHQRTFVIEVMGRNCGYLALMSALATGADYALMPEFPPDAEDWVDDMCQTVLAGRRAGRRDSIIVVAEGARDRNGQPITAAYIKEALEERLHLDTRVTILGHVQRGGAPSAFDRYMSTLMGNAAVDVAINAQPGDEPQIIGMRENRINPVPLRKCLDLTHRIAAAIEARQFDEAVGMRGRSFSEGLQIFRTLSLALPHPVQQGQRRLRLGVMNASGPAPGMNTATRAAVRLGLDKGHIMLGIENGFRGLIRGEIRELDWMSVDGWASLGGSEFGTSRKVPHGGELYAIARNIEDHEIDGLLIIGGWTGYEASYELFKHRTEYPAFNIPIICLPTTINNNLPGSELSVGADTALNSIVEVVDKIKQSAVASNRAFVVEVMGRYCGYLALMSGLATGAERVYLHEEGVTLQDLQDDVQSLISGFAMGKRLGLMIRSEYANPVYTTTFMGSLFEVEGGDLFGVRQAILGHLQQGGDPTPFDRIQATRLASRCIDFLIQEARKPVPASAFIGLQGGHVELHDMEDMLKMMDLEFKRPREQWWLALRPVMRLLAQAGPSEGQARVN